ncbi:hypothetical protein NDU88_003301 [Pleurodeles waltl]|uniref:Uncharacterized protein n=1 Tax=Pleurodeles waltl TaxID=8319 RepID=A0AAV7LEZ5_PLEWA|nr:hypothetical protein NDU88_003301 [Pleurodeles waltl]
MALAGVSRPALPGVREKKRRTPGSAGRLETKSANRVIWLHQDRDKVKVSGRPRWSPARLQVAGGLG